MEGPRLEKSGVGVGGALQDSALLTSSQVPPLLLVHRARVWLSQTRGFLGGHRNPNNLSQGPIVHPRPVLQTRKQEPQAPSICSITNHPRG